MSAPHQRCRLRLRSVRCGNRMHCAEVGGEGHSRVTTVAFAVRAPLLPSRALARVYLPPHSTPAQLRNITAGCGSERCELALEHRERAGERRRGGVHHRVPHLPAPHGVARRQRAAVRALRAGGAQRRPRRQVRGCVLLRSHHVAAHDGLPRSAQQVRSPVPPCASGRCRNPVRNPDGEPGGEMQPGRGRWCRLACMHACVLCSGATRRPGIRRHGPACLDTAMVSLIGTAHMGLINLKL